MLDTRGVEAAADPAVSRRFVAAVAAARRRGPVRFVAPSAVLVEVYRGAASADAGVDRLIGRGECQVVERLPRATSRAAAVRRRRRPGASAVDAIVAEEAAGHPGCYLLTSDADADADALTAIKARRTTVLVV